jgi:pimeloyl-ACP methyl ester carboxylesterase
LYVLSLSDLGEELEHRATRPSTRVIRPRLAGITFPTTVIWGDADRSADPGYGRAFAAAVPRARFDLLPKTGHLPQLESPDLLLAGLSSTAGWR